MTFIKKNTVTVTLSTLGAGSGYSTDFNGNVSAFSVSASSNLGAGSKVTITSTSTQKAIGTVVDPSTLGTWYYPRALAQGTTGNTLGSSGPAMIPLCEERCKVAVTSSSAHSGQTVTVEILVG